ncbi:hypothetical protein VaNZ11_012951, partial [Volvox africanus]
MQEELNDNSPFVTNGPTLVSLGIIVLVGAVASSSGVGGGAIFIPLLNVLVGFNLKSSTSLSQACITCGAAAALLANLMMHHPCDPRVPLVDFTLVAILTPILLMGVGIGVMLNVMLPSELLLGLLLLLLALLIGQSVNKGRALWLQENALRSRHQPHDLRPGQEPAAATLERSSVGHHRPGGQQRRRRRFPGGGGGGGGGGDDDELREPLLGDGGVGVSSSSSPLPPLLSPQRCLTPAPTAIWHLNELEEARDAENVGAGAGAGGDTGGEGAVPAVAVTPRSGYVLRGGVHDDDAVVAKEHEVAAAAVGFDCMEHVDCNIGGGVVTAAAAMLKIINGAPAGPQDLNANAGGPGDGGVTEGKLDADFISPATATGVGDDAPGAPAGVTSPLSSPWRQQQLARGSSMTRGPTAVFKSPFLRQSPPRKIAVTDMSTATAAACTTTTPATAIESHIVTVQAAIPPTYSSTALDSSLIRPRAAVAAAPLSPDAVAAFAEALAAALAADAAASPGTTWSSTSWLAAAATSLFALAAPPWRAFNELGVVDDDHHGDCETHVYDTHHANAHEQYDINSPCCRDHDCEAGQATEAGDGAASTSGHQPLLSLVVIPHGGGADEELGGTAGGSGIAQDTHSPHRRLKGLPGLQLSGSGRRCVPLTRPHSARCGMAAASMAATTAGRRSLGEGRTPSLAAVAAAAAVTFLGKEEAGGGGGLSAAAAAAPAAGLPPVVSPLDTPERREGSRPGVVGSPTEEGDTPPPPPPPPPPLQGPSYCASLQNGIDGAAVLHGPEHEVGPPVAAPLEAAEEPEDQQLLSEGGVLRGSRPHVTSDGGEEAPVIGSTDATGGAVAVGVSVVGVVRVTSVISPAVAASLPGPQLRNQGSRPTTEGGLFAGQMAALRRIPPAPVVALMVAWGIYFGLQFLRSRVPRCSPLWWALVGGQALGMAGLSVGALLVAATPAAAALTASASVAARMTLHKNAGAAAAVAASLSSANSPLPRDWPSQQLAVVLRAPVAVLAATCAAGLAGGLLGLGGGMVMGPLLLHLGLHPQVTAATSGAMVLFSSSAALAQFALMG